LLYFLNAIVFCIKNRKVNFWRNLFSKLIQVKIAPWKIPQFYNTNSEKYNTNWLFNVLSIIVSMNFSKIVSCKKTFANPINCTKSLLLKLVHDSNKVFCLYIWWPLLYWFSKPGPKITGWSAVKNTHSHLCSRLWLVCLLIIWPDPWYVFHGNCQIIMIFYFVGFWLDNELSFSKCLMTKWLLTMTSRVFGVTMTSRVFGFTPKSKKSYSMPTPALEISTLCPEIVTIFWLTGLYWYAIPYLRLSSPNLIKI